MCCTEFLRSCKYGWTPLSQKYFYRDLRLLTKLKIVFITVFSILSLLPTEIPSEVSYTIVPVGVEVSLRLFEICAHVQSTGLAQ